MTADDGSGDESPSTDRRTAGNQAYNG